MTGLFFGSTGAEETAKYVGFSDEQIATAVAVSKEKDQGKQAATIASAVAKGEGASDSDAAAAGAIASAVLSRDGRKHKNPCPIADKWFDGTEKYHGVSPEDWDKYTCSEKQQIAANPAWGLQAVHAEREAKKIADQVKKAAGDVGKIFRGLF